MVDAAPGVRAQAVHDSYPQVVDSVRGAAIAVMLERTARGAPSRPWKARLFWGSACGRDLRIACSSD